MSRGGNTFLRALSSFWNRLFADKDTLLSVYAGTEETLGQVYFNLMEAVLGPSLVDVPAFHKENWQLLLVRQDQLEWNATTGYWEYLLPNRIRGFDFLCDRIINPIVPLERTFDFFFREELHSDGTDKDVYLILVDYPFSAGTNAGSLDGYAVNYTRLDVPTIHTQGIDGVYGLDGTDIVSLEDEFRPLDYTFTEADVGRFIVLPTVVGSTSYKIIEVRPERSNQAVRVVDSSGASPEWTTTTSGVPWRLETQNKTKQIAFWVPNALIDTQVLADNFGVLVSRFEPSSESYKSLLRGITQFFVKGPSSERLESILNIVTSVPVASADGEVFKSIVTGHTPVYDLVVTNLGSYTIPINSGRDDLFDPVSVDTLTFNAFEPFTKIFSVKDTQDDPTWWHNIVIPPVLWEKESYNRRTSKPELYEFVIGNPTAAASGINSGYPEFSEFSFSLLSVPCGIHHALLNRFPGLSVAP